MQVALDRAAGVAGQEQRQALVLVDVANRPSGCRRAPASDRAGCRRRPACSSASRGSSANSADVVACSVFANSAIFSGSSPWCDSGVERRLDAALRDRSRELTSRAILNDDTRVMSVLNASTCRSNISFDVLLERVGHADRRVGQLARRRRWRCTPRSSGCAARSRGRRRDSRRAGAGRRARGRCRRRDDRSREPSRGCCDLRARRARALGRSSAPSPNSRSNTTRGSLSIGSGVRRRRPARWCSCRRSCSRSRSRRREPTSSMRELERRKRRVLAELLRVDLVDRRAGREVGAFGLLRVRGGQEHRARARMVARLPVARTTPPPCARRCC